MEWTWLIVIVLVVAPLVGGLFHTSADVNKFVALGDIKGKPIAEIIAAVGPPTSISAVANGTLYQWQRITGGSGYHYAILVDQDEKAVGYTHQFVS